MRPNVLLLAAALCSLAACGGDEAPATNETPPGANAPPRTPEVVAAGQPAGPDSMTIVSRDGNVYLTLLRDTVSMRLSEKLLAEVRQKIEQQTAESGGGGLGGVIGRAVTGAVQQALKTDIARPVSEIEDVRYENGAIRFRYTGNWAMSFEKVDVNERPALEAFTPEDAQRFVAAVQAAKQRAGGE